MANSSLRGQLSDQIRQRTVTRITTRLYAQGAGKVVGDRVPVQEEPARVGFEEHVPGQVERKVLLVELAAPQRPAQVVGGEDVQLRVADVRGDAGHAGKDGQHRRPGHRRRLRSAAAPRRRWLGVVGQIV